MAKHILTAVVALALGFGAAAQIGHRGAANVTLGGSTANAVGKRVELYSYSDMLTMREVLEDEAVVDSAGRFALEFYTRYPRLVVVQVETYTQSFYVEPGRDYKVYLPEFDWTVDERQNVYLQPVTLPLEFLDLPADELNLRLGAFEHVVDSFVVANRATLDPRFKPRRSTFDTLQTLVERRFRPDVDDDFFGRYVTYTLAEMRYTMRFASRRAMVSRYVADQPVRYYDEQYMRLFVTLMADCVSHGTRRIPMERLTEWVRTGDLATYLDSIGLDPLLRNEQVRELAALVALKESYYMPEYSREGVVEMVRRLGGQSRFDEHRTLAASLITAWDAEADEAEADDVKVVLPDVERTMVDLDSLRGKWVYVAFVRSGDPHSLAELETMAHFHDSVCADGRVEFVSVCCDREFQKMYHLLKNSRRGQRYNWLWLHFDGQYRMLEHYGVVSYPTFVLLDPEGRRVYELTPAPATGFLMHGPWKGER